MNAAINITGFTIAENGDMILTADSDFRDEISAFLADGRDPSGEIAEMILDRCNDGPDFILPEWVGAMTDAPIIAEHVNFTDDGTPEIEGRVWWFPSYMVTDPWRELADTGVVRFTLGA